ncbi:cupin domain-containing protein [Carnobacterium gallinarum]|uniref:cupin domain-containing protein n=1 Tax=Carnobacterium gallinarum TaxID=2749 RepID=UPI00054FF40B|nr:cupin domain-containing protein [Carnobacterium gallinarum]
MKKIFAEANEYNLKDFFIEEGLSVSSFRMGTISVLPGERVPKEGVSVHEENEYSYIISGGMTGESGGEAFEISGGMGTLIPAGEEHWCINESDVPCEICWVLIK